MVIFARLPNTHTIGQKIEQLSLNYLKQRQLQLCHKNFSCKMGEIDLIMVNESTLIFIEVRFRKKRSHGDPVETVNQRKRQKIIRTAQLYLQQHPERQKYDCRFDILGVSTYNSEISFNWVRNAFTFDDF